MKRKRRPCWRTFPRGKTLLRQLHPWSLGFVFLRATPQFHCKTCRQGSTHLTKPVECIEEKRAQKFPFLLGKRVYLPFNFQISQVQGATWDRVGRKHTLDCVCYLCFAFCMDNDSFKSLYSRFQWPFGVNTISHFPEKVIASPASLPLVANRASRPPS